MLCGLSFVKRLLLFVGCLVKSSPSISFGNSSLLLLLPRRLRLEEDLLLREVFLRRDLRRDLPALRLRPLLLERPLLLLLPLQGISTVASPPLMH